MPNLWQGKARCRRKVGGRAVARYGLTVTSQYDANRGWSSTFARSHPIIRIGMRFP